MGSNTANLLSTFSEMHFAIPKFEIWKINACVNCIFPMLLATRWPKFTRKISIPAIFSIFGHGGKLKFAPYDKSERWAYINFPPTLYKLCTSGVIQNDVNGGKESPKTLIKSGKNYNSSCLLYYIFHVLISLKKFANGFPLKSCFFIF